MTCRRFKRHLVLDLYEELSEKDRRKLRSHLERCPACRRELEETRTALERMEIEPARAVPEPDWDASWRSIEAGLEPGRTAPVRKALLPRWAYAAAALAGLFILGIAVGRYWRPSDTGTIGGLTRGTDILSPTAIRSALGSYFEDVEPLLTSYSNDGSADKGEAHLTIDREAARTLLVQNLLLKRALARKDPRLADLLDDLRFILTEIANLRSQNSETPSDLKKAIHERQVLTRVRRWDKI
jgi:hypothetical protein